MIEAAELLLPVEDGARAVARHYLKQASEASERLSSDAQDEEALHDFRVAVRRLRSWLRAFARELSEVRKRDERKLRKLAHATNPGRDAQVQLEWIDDVVKHGSTAEKTAARWMHDTFDERRLAYEADVARLIDETWPTIEKKLKKRLDATNANDEGRRLAEAIVARVPKSAEDLWLALAEVHAIGDEQQAHAARISAKRLRYLIEPAAPHVASGELLRERLKALQDDLGRLHDLHVLADEVFDVAPLAGRLRRDLERTFDRVRTRWLNQPMILAEEIAAFAQELEEA